MIPAFYRDYAKLAGAYWLEVRVAAECWHIRSRLAGSIENGRSIGYYYLSTIDGKFNFRHVPTAPDNDED
jgi:hypothetical protein